MEQQVTTDQIFIVLGRTYFEREIAFQKIEELEKVQQENKIFKEENEKLQNQINEYLKSLGENESGKLNEYLKNLGENERGE